MEIVCSICGISGKMRGVFEVISPKGVVLACEKCVFEEGFPILKKPDKKAFEEPERKGTVYERMARLSGVKPREPERPELKKQEKSLREIIDKNYEEKMKMQDLSLKSRPDLVDKFHWIIMRVRRVRGLTQKQLAEAINETEAAIKMAEQGIVPEGYELIEKLGRFLRVKLIKEKILSSLGQIKERDSSLNKTQIQKTLSLDKIPLNFDKKGIGSLTIADLQRIKKERLAEMWEDEEEEEKETEEKEFQENEEK